ALPEPEVAAEPRPPAPPTAPEPRSWTMDFVDPGAGVPLPREAGRFAVGLGLAAIYGAALGARAGGAALLGHAVGVPAALLAAFGLGTPALTIALAFFDAPVDPPAAAAAAARGVASAGIVLAGLAPAAALFVVSSERPGAAALAAGIGLAAGFTLGLGRFYREIAATLSRAPLGTRSASGAALLA